MLIFSAINLGCTKNLVDTQYLLGKIFFDQEKEGKMMYCPEPYDEEVELVLLNTCGFIKSARDEMFEVIEELLSNDKRVCIVGCGLQYFEGLANSEGGRTNSEEGRANSEEGIVNSLDKELVMNNVDDDGDESIAWSEVLKNDRVQFLSWGDFDKVSVEELIGGYSSQKVGDFKFPKVPRAYTNLDQGFEYIKIAEGCMNSCSFCIIPQIRGKQVSLSIDTIVAEVKDLVEQGVKEIILIAQDSTRYGVDLMKDEGGRMNNIGDVGLMKLMKEIDTIEGDFLYRVLYLYPDVLTMGWLEEMKKLNKFIPYFDLPLQHINPFLLNRMKRFSDVDKIRQLLTYIRDAFEESYIRTNFIIGFPGETEEHVEELKAFIEEDLIDNVALFEYHDEPLATSSKLDGKLSDEVVHERFLDIKNTLDPVKNKRSIVDKKVENVGYVEGYEDGKIVVRPWLHAPEIDATISLDIEQIKENLSGGDELEIGDMILYK